MCVCKNSIFYLGLWYRYIPHPFHLWSISSSRWREKERETINDGIDHWCPAPQASLLIDIVLYVSTIFWGVFSSSSVLLLRSWCLVTLVVCFSFSFFFFFHFLMTDDRNIEKRMVVWHSCCVISWRSTTTIHVKHELPFTGYLNWYIPRGCNTITGITNKHMPYFIVFLFLVLEQRKRSRYDISWGVFASFDTTHPTAWSWCSNGW